MATINVLILAEGLGTRMKSDQAKVLHKLGSRPLIDHILRTAVKLNPEKIFVVVGHQAEKVEEAARAALDAAGAEKLSFVLQKEQRGTGHAVIGTEEATKQSRGSLLILYGDTPLVRPETLRKLNAEHERGKHAATFLTIRLVNPPAYGRIIRDPQGNFLKIIEERDCTPEQRRINELNPGFY